MIITGMLSRRGRDPARRSAVRTCFLYHDNHQRWPDGMWQILQADLAVALRGNHRKMKQNHWQ